MGVLRALGLIGPAFLLWTAVCGLLGAVPGQAQGGSISGQVISPAGYPVAYGLVRICPTTSTGSPCSPLTANVYADPALTVPVANPYTTDGFGNYSLFVAAGNYYIVQVSFTSNQQPYTYAYLVAAASSSVAVAAPQYSLATYTAAGTGTTLGESYVDPTNGQLRTDATGGLYVAGMAHFYNSLTGTTLTGSTFNATGSYEVNGTQIAAANLLNGVTGSGAIVLANSPTLTTPVLGVATGTSLTLTGLASGAGEAVCLSTGGLLVAGGCSGSGTVTSFSAGALSPLFTTSVATATTTPALTFSASTAAQNSVLAGPASGGAGAYSFQTAPTISVANMTNFPVGSNSAEGVVQCDGTSTQCTAGVISTKGTMQWGSVSGCLASGSTICTSVLTWGTAFADTGYSTICTPEGLNSSGAFWYVSAQSTTTVTISTTVLGANNPGGYTTFVCLGRHS